jgi:predicted Zn-dependent protease
LQEDKDNVPATETMGFVEFREGHIEEAKKWYAKAVKLDSQSFLAHYYFAAISMNSAVGPDEEAQVENSFRASIQLNPSFGPSYNALAAFLGQRHRNLEEARMMGLNAVQLEPGNLNYRLNYANVLLQMERGTDAVTVIRKAMHLAKTPEEAESAQAFLDHAEQYANAREQSLQVNEQIKADPVATRTDAKLMQPIPIRREIAPEGPHRFLSGVLKDVRCDNPAMNLSLVSGQKKTALHSGDYFEIEFSALGFAPPANLNPCRDLEGRSAKVEYVDAGKDAAAWIVSIEMHK